MTSRLIFIYIYSSYSSCLFFSSIQLKLPSSRSFLRDRGVQSNAWVIPDVVVLSDIVCLCTYLHLLTSYFFDSSSITMIYKKGLGRKESINRVHPFGSWPHNRPIGSSFAPRSVPAKATLGRSSPITPPARSPSPPGEPTRQRVLDVRGTQRRCSAVPWVPARKRGLAASFSVLNCLLQL